MQKRSRRVGSGASTSSPDTGGLPGNARGEHGSSRSGKRAKWGAVPVKRVKGRLGEAGVATVANRTRGYLQDTRLGARPPKVCLYGSRVPSYNSIFPTVDPMARADAHMTVSQHMVRWSSEKSCGDGSRAWAGTASDSKPPSWTPTRWQKSLRRRLMLPEHDRRA